MKRKIVLLTILAVLLATSSFAAGYQINATLRPDIKVVIDGVTQTFKDAKGSVVYPISYNNTTYLPIRAIGGIMGKSVDWEGSTQTIYLGGKPNTMTHAQISDKLIEVYNWIVGDIWNDAYVNIEGYVDYGQDCYGNQMSSDDLKTVLTNLDSAMEKKAGYDSFIKSLSDIGYSELKTTWNDLMVETDALYAQIKNKTPQANDKEYKFDSSMFVEYRDAFYTGMDKVR